MTEVKCKNCGAGGHSELSCSYKEGAFRHKHKWVGGGTGKNSAYVIAWIFCEKCGEIKKGSL